MSNLKLWFSLYDPNYSYPYDEPSFFVSKNHRWAKDFELNYQLIKKELEQFLESHQLVEYFNRHMVNTESTWKTISLRWWTIEFFKNQSDFPKTMELVNRYPEIISVSFNQLESQGEILPHCGDTNAIFRCHFGLEIPAQLPECGFRVKEETRSWEAGKWLVFTDANEHEAFNRSEKRRIIMVIDVLREEFKPKKNLIFSTVLTSLFLQKRIQQMMFITKLSATVRKFIGYSLTPFAFCAVKVVNKLKIY
ncbi:MAG: aspartyl/asparaginyl beta-hydroxylase domain-containing protein [Bacteroidetes bacterium]|nr:aspartyl/asparaginyl beta-hydroxylase domain-containing protein [Bacteroidota bacterium]